MKKLSVFAIIFIILSVWSFNTSYAENKNTSKPEALISKGAAMGNTNGNIANGGYIVGSQNGDNIFYAYGTQRPELPENAKEPALVKDESMQGIKVLSEGLNCRCLNNYKDEWIYYLKDNDGKIYRSKTDGSRTEELETDFNADAIIIIGDYIIVQTYGFDKGNIVAADLNGNLIKVIVNDDPRLNNLMLNIDENYVYYHNEIDNKIYRVSYDGNIREEIYSGAVDDFQVFDNKLYVKGREWLGKKDILYIYDMNEYDSQSEPYDTKSEFMWLSSVDYISEFNVSDMGIFFVRAPYGNALLYHCDLDGSNTEWVDIRTVFDWNIYVINGKVYQYDIIGGAMDKAAEVGNIHSMNNKSYNAPAGSYTINDR